MEKTLNFIDFKPFFTDRNFELYFCHNRFLILIINFNFVTTDS